jgi:Asp/Glu/hydantoin racemase
VTPIVVTLIHATPAAMPPMARALARVPEVRPLNLLDEALLAEVDRHGGLTTECRERMATHLTLAQQAGSRAVLVTCNIYSSVLDDLRPRFPDMPLVAVDQAMLDLAVRSAQRIGVLATVANGLRQQSDLLLDTAHRLGREVKLTSVLREDAFAALVAGDGPRHDQILLEALPPLARQVEVVVLAQASMARLLDVLTEPQRAGVLASPDLAVAELARLLGLRVSSIASPAAVATKPLSALAEFLPGV